MRRLFILSFIGLVCLCAISQKLALSPDILYGKLFRDVQMKPVFPDSKTFVDCIPKTSPEVINSNYRLLGNDSVSKETLTQFVIDNFIIPVNPPSTYKADKSEPVQNHINRLWKVLQREPDTIVAGSSLLPLPYLYIVPGGRFREIYYWDSYFTMLGLVQSGEWEMIENMIRNFSYLIQTYGQIPNGNRTYYLSRSQPPFFCMMIQMLAMRKGDVVYPEYLNSLQKEYDYWMDKTAATRHVVIMPNGAVLNRYYDQDSIPRQESYREDYLVALKESQGPDHKNFSNLCRNLRSSAESGWDFSSRWFADGKNIGTIQTTDIIPVDLNGLIFQMELTLAHAYKVTGDRTNYDLYLQKSKARKAAINTYCWNEKGKWYVDYDIVSRMQSPEYTAAGITLLFFNIASAHQAALAESTLTRRFLKSGGIVTTLRNTGQQWDAPNGWAPLQWMAIKGLENYGKKNTAHGIARRWIKLNQEVYKHTGKLMEKYNVENTSLEAEGGEYSDQDGFGWTNGVLLKLMALYGK